MTAREVVELIKKNATVPWNERSPRDTFKAGNPDVTVKGIATTMMVTFDMLKRANAAGLNMVITHEDTFWNDPDNTKDLAGNPLYKLKTEYILKNNMVVWRDHDNMHASTPDYTVVGELRSAGIPAGPGQRESVDASGHFDDPGDDSGRTRGSSETIKRRPRASLRRRSESKGEQDSGGAGICDSAHS
jgi:hypothetical protein